MTCSITCLHCAVSRALLTCQAVGMPVTTQQMCELGQVTADVIASLNDRDERARFGGFVRTEINRMIDEAIAGTWGRS